MWANTKRSATRGVELLNDSSPVYFFIFSLQYLCPIPKLFLLLLPICLPTLQNPFLLKELEE